jgi:hypothetical protein
MLATWVGRQGPCLYTHIVVEDSLHYITLTTCRYQPPGGYCLLFVREGQRSLFVHLPHSPIESASSGWTDLMIL